MNPPEEFPFEAWLADMQSAITQICKAGANLFEEHRQASDKAEKAALLWKLESRLDLERDALEQIVQNARSIVTGVLELKPALRSMLEHSDMPDTSKWESLIGLHSRRLDKALPAIESNFAEVRHHALDLLRWSSRAGHLEGSSLPDEYRSTYAQLISYAPVFDQLSDSLRDDVEALYERTAGADKIQQLLRQLTRQRQLRHSIRSFLKSIIDPPFELIFEETDSFLSDWENYSNESRLKLATHFNDCCQLLLYDEAAFHQKVESIAPPLKDGMEATLQAMELDNDRILFLVDEDPVFEEVHITLLRIIPSAEFSTARESIVRSLYQEFLAI